MASGGRFLYEDQFKCSICLDVFNEPVSTPCGHNFCKICIKRCWQTATVSQCPLCKTKFRKKPNLKVNTFISELSTRFTMLRKVKDSRVAKPFLLVFCEICDYPKLKAVKSCLECLTSYCEVHLEPHHRVAGLMIHTLLEPDFNLDKNICRDHNMLFTLFCQVDKVTLCDICAGMHHKSHKIIPVRYEYRKKLAQLGRTEATVQQMIQDRMQKIQELKLSSQQEGEKAIATTIQDSSALVSAIQTVHAEYIRVVEKMQRATDKQAEGFITELEQELIELQGAHAQVRYLMHTENPVLFLQDFPSQSILPKTKDWSTVDIKAYLGMEVLNKYVKKSMSQLLLILDEMSKEIKNDWYQQVFNDPLQLVQQYKVELSLDPETAHPSLSLSDDGKQVRYSQFKKRLPTNPKRFTVHLAVLGNRFVSSGKFYYEVYVGGKTEWNLGVAGESLPRSAEIVKGPECNIWAIQFIVDACLNFCEPPEVVYQGKVGKVGVFVEYEAGLVSFYDVNSRSRIYSYTGCNFTEKLYPYFNPCDNEHGSNLGPLVIVSVGRSLLHETQ